MRRFLDSRSPRERVMIALAALLVVALGLSAGVYRPLAEYRARERQAWSAALDRLAQVEAQAVEILALRSSPDDSEAAGRDLSLRSIAGRSAKEAGLTVSRLSPSDSGRLEIWFETAKARRLFGWMARIEERYGVTIAKATVSANDEAATVRAQLTLARGEAAS